MATLEDAPGCMIKLSKGFRYKVSIYGCVKPGWVMTG